jgi:hypothetical protein
MQIMYAIFVSWITFELHIWSLFAAWSRLAWDAPTILQSWPGIQFRTVTWNLNLQSFSFIETSFILHSISAHCIPFNLCFNQASPLPEVLPRARKQHKSAASYLLLSNISCKCWQCQPWVPGKHNQYWSGSSKFRSLEHVMHTPEACRSFIWNLALHDIIYDIISHWYWLWYHMFWIVYDIIWPLYHDSESMVSMTYDFIIGLS